MIDARGLPAAPLDAAQAFSQRHVGDARAAAPHDCVVIFDAADHTHDGWRLAMVQELAREAVPGRVNAIVGNDKAAIAQVRDFLAGAPGVTGQVFTTNGNREDNR